MSTVPVQIVRFVLEHQPNIVGCVLTDAFGRQWNFEDKVVYFTEAYLDEQSGYPQPGTLPCKVEREWTDERGRRIATISSIMEETTGETQFDVLADQITTNVA
jgi:ADP-ribosylglycohydrolase